MKPAFLFDPDRCTGCEACRIACDIENNHGADSGWRTITTFNPSRHPALPTRHLSLACNHCETPACAIGCPAAAYDRDEKTGAVLLDPEKCIGCRYCSWLCPYDAPKFDESHGVMTKCTFCNTRMRGDVAQTLLSVPRDVDGSTDKSVCATQAPQPACTAACPTGALSLGAREPAPEPVYHGLGAFGLGPALRVQKPRHAGPPPAMAIDELVLDAPRQPRPARKITLSSEWALLVFTIVMPALVGLLGGGVVVPVRRPSLLIFLALSAVAIALSTIHLGKPLRAWRAILNVRTSWLSREIAFTNLFVLAGAAYLAIPRPPAALGLVAVASGIALAFSMDAVYRAIPRVDSARVHSAETILTVALLIGITAAAPLLTIAAALVKAALFGRRWMHHETGVREPFGVIRMLLLAIVCVPVLPWGTAFALAVAGELIDRAAFYNAVEPTTPATRMAAEMAASR